MRPLVDYISYSSGWSSGPLVELRGRDADLVSAIIIIQAERIAVLTSGDIAAVLVIVHDR